MKSILKSALCFGASLIFADTLSAQTPHVMSSGDYNQNFSTISSTTDWPNNMGASGTPSAPWRGVAVDTTGTIPSGTRVTTSTATFVTGSSGGVQRGTENIQLLSTGGNPGNTSSAAIDLYLDFTNRNAGNITFDAATVFNSTGDRLGTLRVYATVDGTNFVELTGTNLPYVATNNVEGSASIADVNLPAAFNNVPTARLRFYYHNGPNGTVGSRPKISIDNILVTSTPQGTPTIAAPNPSAPEAFTTTYGTPSATQTFAISGSGLTQAITATAPSGFEVSSDNVTWGPTASFPQTSGSSAGDLRVRLAATAPVSGTYNEAVIALTSTGATTVNLTTPAAGNAVSPKALEIIATDVVKPFGETLNEINPGSTAFTSDGLANSEAIGSVTITYLNGFASGAAAQVYTNAVVPSAATGGTFTPGNYTITYTPGDLTVSSAPLVQISGTLNAFSTVYGTASAAQSFTVSGSALTANLVVTAPAGYQVSLNPDSDFVTILQLGPDSGTVPSTTLYLRLRADTPFGAVAAGNVTAASTGATTQNLLVPAGNVSAKELTITGLTGTNKVYDRTMAGSFTGTPLLNGVVAGDGADVVLESGGVTATFAQTAPGTGLTLTVAGFAISGSKAGNYTVTQPVLTADISAKELTLLNPAVTTRAFNGTTSATITGTLDGVIAGDTVNFTGTGTFANVGPGAPIAVTASIVLTGAAAGNYTLVQPTGLSGRINGSATGNTIAQWTFEGDVITPAVGTGTASLIGGTTATFAAGNGGGRAWNLATFPAQGTASGTAGVQFAVPTTGTNGISISFDHRGSSTPSRWARVDYSLDGGANWTENYWNNHDEANGGRATGISPDSVFYTFNVNFSGVAGADNNPNFRVRIVSMFSPLEFVANSVSNPANSAYQPAGTSGTATYAVGGTWRFDNVTFSGNPPFHFIGSTPAHGATDVAPTSTIQLTFSKPALLTTNAVTMLDADNNVIPFAGLPVTEAAAVVTLTPTAPLPYGKAITVTLVRDEITSGGNPLESTTATIPVTFTTEAAVTPVVNVTPASVEVPINTVATLTANVTAGSAPVTLQWYEGDAGNFGAATLLTGQTGTTLEVTHPTVATRSFFVRATSAANESVNSNTVPVSFTNFVLVTGSTPANAATGVLTDSGITITFSKGVKLQPGGVTISPAVPFTLSPAFNAAEFATSYTLTPDSPLAASTLYTVTVLSALVTDVDAAGMAADYAFSFTTVVPVTITGEPQLQNVNVNGTAVFTVTATGDGPLTYDWRRNGISLGADSSPTLTLTNVQLAQAGIYSVVVTGPGTGNTATSVSAALNVTFPTVTLTGTSYTQDFNSLSSGLPTGWGVYSAATATTLGTPATLAANTEAASAWAQTTGNFRNAAAFSADLVGSSTAAEQFARTNRALAVRQAGTAGANLDPGASFNVAINSLGKNVTGLSFKAQMLNVQPRSTVWSVQVGVGASPATWETIGIYNDPGTFGSTELTFGETELASLGNQSLIWIRIVALNVSTGSGNRDTFGIDDFVLTYEDDLPPLTWDTNGVNPGAGGPAPVGIWGTDSFWSSSEVGDVATTAWVPGSKAAFSAGADATGPFTVTLDGVQDARWVIFEEGTVTLSGGTLNLSSGAPRLLVQSESATIASLITGSAGFIKVGSGLVALTNANTFTGLVTLGAGTLEISSDAALGNSANDVRLGGTLSITQSMTLGSDRDLIGAGTIQLSNAADLVIGGNINTISLGLTGPGSVAFSGATNLLGNLTVGASVALTGNTLTLTNLTSSSGTATVANEIVFSPTLATVLVEDGGALTLNGPISMGNLAATDRLVKTGAGTLVLPVANPNLFKVGLGLQGAVPVDGGTIRIGNKSALGTSISFLNFGTLEVTTPLTGDNAIPHGISISGRSDSPVVITGQNLDVDGTNNIYGAATTLGNVVRLNVLNETRFTGSFVVDGTSPVPVNTLSMGGTGKVTFAGPSFPIALILSDTVTAEVDTEAIATGSSAASGLLVEAGSILHPGTEGGARVVAVSNSFTLQNGGKVVFDITGPGSGQFDALNLVSGTASHVVAGTLELRFGAGYAPQAGHQFHILQFPGTATADLSTATLELPVLDSPLSWDTSAFATSGIILIDGPGAGLAPIITSPPQSILDAFTNDFVAFAVTAVGAVPLSYQWLYYGQPVNNATGSSLTFNASTANAGVYSVRVSNANGSVVSSPAFLVVNGLPIFTQQPQKVIAAEGEAASFSFSSFGTVTSVQWQFNPGSGFVNLDGETGLTLNRTAGTSTYGGYRVVIGNTNGTVTSFVAALEAPYNGPPTSRPEWDYTGDLPPGQVGVVYAFTPGLKPDEPLNSIYRSADRFTATGLPAGLTINSATGEISGTPVAIKATPYAVKITARNINGTAVLATRILINPLPTGGLGVFTGPIQRSAILDGIVTGNNGALGGRFDMTVSATSAVSGKVTLGAKAYSFRGVRATIPTAPANRLSLAATIRVNATVNLVMNLLVDTLTGTILDTSTITDGTTTVTFKGWRNPWGTKAPATQATTLAGYYTTKLDLVDGALTSSQAPVGSGYLSFTVAPKTGTLKLSGKLSDGSTITMATFAGPSGQILLFRPLYAAAVRGSVLGELGIAAEPDPLNNTVDGDLSWTRPANAAASNRLYKAGFPVPGELAVKVDGARYVAPTPRNSRNPTAEPRVMGLTDAANEIEVLLTGAGVETALPLQTNVKANVALNNKVTFNLDPLVNTRKMTLTFNAAKGTFTGRVTLKQNNPLLEMSVPPLLVPVTRTVTYQGLIVKGAGAGYFILAQLPAMAGDTPTKTAQEGGKAEIKAVPVIP